MATARRKRNQQTTDDVFEMSLVDALPRVLAARHIAVGDDWAFSINGADLRIIRTRRVFGDVPDEPD